jgi:hypothetical protein
MGKRLNPFILHYRDKPYSHLKPGQATMERDFYAKANKEFPDGKVVLSNFTRYESVYGQNIAKNVAPGDYTVPLKNNNTMCNHD